MEAGSYASCRHCLTFPNRVILTKRPKGEGPHAVRIKSPYPEFEAEPHRLAGCASRRLLVFRNNCTAGADMHSPWQNLKTMKTQLLRFPRGFIVPCGFPLDPSRSKPRRELCAQEWPFVFDRGRDRLALCGALSQAPKFDHAEIRTPARSADLASDRLGELEKLRQCQSTKRSQLMQYRTEP